MVIFQDVSKFILSNVNIHVPQGCIVGIIGASGAGKTTFLKLACGMLEPAEGMVYTMRKPAVKEKRGIAAELGAVLLHRPKLIILDEPSIGLDRNAGIALRELLEERKQEGATILVSSHDMEEISSMCERILLLDRGRSIFYGTQELLLKKYAPMDVCELVFEGKCPDFGNLPIEKYCIDHQYLTFSYDSNHISAAEILAQIVSQTKVLSVQVKKAGLADTIKNIALEGKNAE